EEVTLTYTDPFDAYKEREDLFKNYGFVCQCRLCELDRADARYSEREDLVREALHAYATICALFGLSGGIDVLTERLPKIRATYEGRSELKTRLREPLVKLANSYKRSTRTDKYTAQIRLLTECAQCLGDRLFSQVGDCLYARLAECYDREGDDVNARQYVHMAVEELRISSGCDASVFKRMKPRVAEIDHLL
ncbi:hypothetical protein AAVH_33683, partial [Aphelenchoides avenae]